MRTLFLRTRFISIEFISKYTPLCKLAPNDGKQTLNATQNERKVEVYEFFRVPLAPSIILQK